MWAIGAGVGWLVLRQVPQLVLAALLAPAWLVSEWMVAVGRLYEPTATRVAACGVLLCAVAYLTAVRDGRNEDWRRALFWIGSVALLPASRWDRWLAVRTAVLTVAYLPGRLEPMPRALADLLSATRLYVTPVALGLLLVVAVRWCRESA